MMLKLLVVDDDTAIRNVIKSILSPLGIEVVSSSRGEEAISLVGLVRFDAALLDINMPDIGGVETCRELRRLVPTLPIVMLTVRNTEDDKVEALDAGADDYLVKPFSVRELVARVNAAIRRGQMPANPGRLISIGDVAVCGERRLFFKKGEAIHLTKTQFEIVHLLMRHQGRPVSHKKILSTVWGTEYRNHVEYLRTYVRELRKRIEDDPAHPKYLLTAAYVGYRFRDSSIGVADTQHLSVDDVQHQVDYQ